MLYWNIRLEDLQKLSLHQSICEEDKEIVDDSGYACNPGRQEELKTHVNPNIREIEMTMLTSRFRARLTMLSRYPASDSRIRYALVDPQLNIQPIEKRVNPMIGLTEVPLEKVGERCHEVLMRMLPGLVKHSLDLFGLAVNQVRTRGSSGSNWRCSSSFLR
jgi:hypothetical protein